MRGQEADYNHWAKANPGWSWMEVEKYFNKSLDYQPTKDAALPIDRERFPTGGEWRVESQVSMGLKRS